MNLLDETYTNLNRVDRENYLVDLNSIYPEIIVKNITKKVNLVFFNVVSVAIKIIFSKTKNRLNIGSKVKRIFTSISIFYIRFIYNTDNLNNTSTIFLTQKNEKSRFRKFEKILVFEIEKVQKVLTQ